MFQNNKTRARERKWEGFKQMREEAGGDKAKLKEMKRDARKKKKEEKQHNQRRRGPEEGPHESTAADDQENAGSDDVDALSQSFRSFSIKQEDAGKELQE